MKKYIFVALMMAFITGLNAQQPPMFFHNKAERLAYQLDHPDGFAMRPAPFMRASNEYTLKLDSVVGADNFDWSRWKNQYAFLDSVMLEAFYVMENQSWVPTSMTETSQDNGRVRLFRWTGEEWEHYMTVNYQYLDCNGNEVLESMTAESLDSIWVYTQHSTYEYDEHCNLVLNMNYNGMNDAGEWVESSKYEYEYDDDDLLVRRLYYTKRYGNWRESSLDSLLYDEQGQCVAFSNYRKGGWGPGANVWRLSSKYEITWADGQPVSELLYTSGWYGNELYLDSKNDYQFDANGNLQTKTTSVYNEVEWMVRDEYVNRFDLTVDASSVLGLDQLWETTLDRGFATAMGTDMPLKNQWLNCSIIASNLDTEFTIYCSGFAGVGEEYQEDGLKAYSKKGQLVVECTQPSDVTVYDLTGRVVASKRHASQCEFNLTPGLYLVSNGLQVTKTVVR